MAVSLESGAHNPKVRGSNPLPATINNIKGLGWYPDPLIFFLKIIIPNNIPNTAFEYPAAIRYNPLPERAENLSLDDHCALWIAHQ